MAMEPPNFDVMSQWMGPLSGIGDATRLRLLRLLAQEELGVAELCDVLQMPQSTVSRHLKLLADHGWVVFRRIGTANRYRMLLDELDEPTRQLWTLARHQTKDWATFGQDQLRLAHLQQQSRCFGVAGSFFDGAAGQWLRTRDNLYGDRFCEAAFSALLPEHWIVADLGCGVGDITAELARSVGQVIAVDNSPAMLEVARQYTRDLPNVDLRRGDLAELPIADQTCHAAILLLVLTYLSDPEPALRQMHRILRPGGTTDGKGSSQDGRAVIVDLMRHDREDFRRDLGQQIMGFEPEQLAAMLEAAGFCDVSCQPLPPQPDTNGPALLLATGRRGGEAVESQ